MIELYKKYWTKAFDFKGKISRKDFWFTVLANYLVLLIYSFLILLPASLINESFYLLMYSILFLYGFAQQIPSWSMSVRRLRDSGKAWQWVFINFVLLIGNLYFVYLLYNLDWCLDFLSYQNYLQLMYFGDIRFHQELSIFYSFLFF